MLRSAGWPDAPENIEPRGKTPVWGDRCLTCFACLHWCPERAISLGGLDLGITPYHHLDVTLADMVVQRDSTESPHPREAAPRAGAAISRDPASWVLRPRDSELTPELQYSI